jgi:hypothetical protein
MGGSGAMKFRESAIDCDRLASATARAKSRSLIMEHFFTFHLMASLMDLSDRSVYPPTKSSDVASNPNIMPSLPSFPAALRAAVYRPIIASDAHNAATNISVSPIDTIALLLYNPYDDADRMGLSVIVIFRLVYT